MKPICIYHSSDLDGKCSGAIIFHAHGGEIDLHGMDYGDPVPWSSLENREVVLVDFSFQPFDEMRKLQNITSKLTWLDHHKSALSDAESFHFTCHGYKPDNVEWAGCELAWRHYYTRLLELFPSPLPMPLAVHWLGRYDVWKHEDKPDILAFQAGMKTYETHPTADIWPMLFRGNNAIDGPDFLYEVVRRGEVVQASMKFANEDMAKKLCFETTLDGLRLIAANRGPTGSMFFKSVWDPQKYDAMCAFYLRPDGQWSISLYSDKEAVDVSMVAKGRGGGGHKGAAGFQAKSLPFFPFRVGG